MTRGPGLRILLYPVLFGAALIFAADISGGRKALASGGDAGSPSSQVASHRSQSLLSDSQATPSISGAATHRNRETLSPAPGDAWAVAELQEDLGAILGTEDWPARQWSVLVVSMDQGDTLFARNPHQALVPASNVKLLTSAAALHYLGSAFRFRTFLLADGPVEDGVLDGDLILYGTGDPSISSRFYGSRTQIWERLAARLLDQGIREVRGDLVGDASLFSGPTRHPGWEEEDLSDWFAAPISALSFNENVVTLRVEAGDRAGMSPVVHTIPESTGVPIDNHGSTVESRPRTRLAIYRDAPTGPIQVVGEMTRGAPDVWRRMTVNEPARMAVHTLRSVLRTRGIRVSGDVRQVLTPDQSRVTGGDLWAPDINGGGVPRIVATHVSRPLFDLLQVVNKQSNNLYAEMILRTIGRVVEGDGSFSGGVRAVARFLTEEVGIPADAVIQMDGSGLAAENRASAYAFVRLLSHMADTDLWTPLWESLPVAGNRREMGRMYRTAAAGNLRAKTGTIDGVSALSGVVRSSAGERILFSIIANEVRSNSSTKRVENQMGARLAELDRTFSADTTRGRLLADWHPRGSVHDRSQGVLYYEVQRGENFTVIARRFGIGLEVLIQANPGISSRRLQAGQILEIPVGGQ